MSELPTPPTADGRSDRLLQLSQYRDLLLRIQLKTPAAVLQAAPETIERLRPHGEEVVRLVAAGDPDVLRALFSPALCWSIAYMTPGLRDRTFTIRYEATVEHERRVWRALKAALAGVELPPDCG
jgi:hypothetical protein